MRDNFSSLQVTLRFHRVNVRRTSPIVIKSHKPKTDKSWFCESMVKKQAPQMTKHQRSHQMFFRSLYTVVFTLSMLNLQGIDGHQHCAFTTNRVIPSFHSVTVAQQKQSHFMGSTMHFTPSISTKNPPTTSRSSTALKMSFLGNDGGFFGVGAPEIVSDHFGLELHITVKILVPCLYLFTFSTYNDSLYFRQLHFWLDTLS